MTSPEQKAWMKPTALPIWRCQAAAPIGFLVSSWVIIIYPPGPCLFVTMAYL
uniref:Uncharacterized protein n=1 Tax=Anguilla anguilla TaxID=7936 RepID=A0A0E9WAZ2_ANGAN